MAPAAERESLSVGDAEVAQRREVIRRGLLRSNTATVVALLVTVLLAVLAVFLAVTAERHAGAARQANQRTSEELGRAQLAQARAVRLSGRAGRRGEGWTAVERAARLRPTLALRNEALATLALTDTERRPWGLAVRDTDIVCAFAPGRGVCAWGDVRGQVHVRSLTGDVEVASLVLPGPVMAVAFSPDERWLVAYALRGHLLVWDTQARHTAAEFTFPPGKFNEHALSFHPDSSLLAVCAPEEKVRLIRLADAVELPPLAAGGPPAAAAFDPSGERLAVTSEGYIRIFRLSPQEPWGTVPIPARPLDLAWHPDGGHLAVACSDGRVLLVAANGQATVVLRGHTDLATRVLFDPTGAVLVSTAWDGTTRFWAASSGWPLFTDDTGYARQFDGTGRRLFYHREGTGLREWGFFPATGLQTLATPLEGPRNVQSLDFSRDGAYVVGVTSGGACLWEVRSGRLAAVLPLEDATGGALADDGRTLLISGRGGLQRVALQATPGGQPAFLGPPQPVAGWDGGSLGWGFVARGQPDRFLSGDGTRVVMADLAPGGRVRVVKTEAPFTSLALSPDGRWLVSSRWKGHGTRVWDLEAGGRERRLEDEGGSAMFSPDGRWLAVGSSREFILYATSDWRPVRRLERDAASALSGLVAFSPDGRWLALTPTLRQIQLVTVAGGTEIATFEAPAPDRILTLGFSPDGTRLAAGTDNGGVQLWNLAEVQGRLAPLGLDWRVPAVTDEAAPESGLGGAGSDGGWAAGATGASGSSLRGGAIWLSGTGAGLALLFAFLSIRHHRRLVEAYELVEALAARQRLALTAAQAQLAHSQKMTALGTLAAGVAHDFNNLLSIIRMAGQLVRRQLRPAGPALENLEAIEQAVQQGKSIAHSILGYSRRPASAPGCCRVNEVVSETLAMLNKQYLSGIVLTLEQDPAAPGVQGERSRLEQVLLNLIVNAVEAMRGRGKLTLGVRRRAQAGAGGVLVAHPADHYVEVAVTDTGPGIPPALRTRVFEPFFTTKQSGGEPGTGLGLTTVYAIARDAGWGLELESEPGRGTTFRVLLPALDTALMATGGRGLPIPQGTDSP